MDTHELKEALASVVGAAEESGVPEADILSALSGLLVIRAAVSDCDPEKISATIADAIHKTRRLVGLEHPVGGEA